MGYGSSNVRGSHAVLVVPVAPYDIRVAVVVAALRCRHSAVIQGLLLLGMARETSAKLPRSLAGGSETRSRHVFHQLHVGLRQDNPNTATFFFKEDVGCPQLLIKTEWLNTHVIARTLCATVFVCSGITSVASGLVTLVIHSHFLVSVQTPAEYIFRGGRADKYEG